MGVEGVALGALDELDTDVAGVGAGDALVGAAVVADACVVDVGGEVVAAGLVSDGAPPPEAKSDFRLRICSEGPELANFSAAANAAALSAQGVK